MSTPSILRLKKLRNLEKSREGDAEDSSSFSRLPDEIILQILNKLIDLKILCFCFLVSKRFSSIVLQVNAISFTPLFLNPSVPDKMTVKDVDAAEFPIIAYLYGDSFLSAIGFLRKFKRVKSLCIELPSSSHGAIDNRCPFKWKVKFGNRIESFVYLSRHTIFEKDEFDLNGNGEEEEDDQGIINEMHKQNIHISSECLKDAIKWHDMLLHLVKDRPMLEQVSITDSGRRGRLSLSGEKLSEVKEWLPSACETVMFSLKVPEIASTCYIPVLKLPVSGYVMKGIHFVVMEMKDFQGGYDSFMNSNDGFEDKQGAAYTEAMMEILEKHRGMMVTFVDDALA